MPPTAAPPERPRRPRHLEVPDYGVGVGLRIPHYAYLRAREPSIGFFEIISENFFARGGKPLWHLDHFRERYPLVLHGVSLSIGGPEEPDRQYLAQLKRLVRRVRPAWVTDHLCFTGARGAHLHDLLPLPYTEEAASRVARRARLVQDYLEVPFGLENVSSYLNFRSSTWSEWGFLSRVAEEADCGLLLDVNNVYVSASNHGFDPLEYLRGVPHERVLQIHLADHSHHGTHLLDTHEGRVKDEVLALYREALRLTGPVSTLLEWDDKIPEFPVVEEELARLEGERRRGLDPASKPLECVRLPELRAPEGAAPLAASTTLSASPPSAELDELQLWMTQLLPRTKSLPSSRALAPRAARLVLPSPRLAPLEHLEIYREQFWLRHTGALAEDFPGLAALLGAAAWRELTTSYLERHVPTHFSLRELGARLPRHVEETLFPEQHPGAADLARLEWAYVECFDAEDGAPLDLTKAGTSGDFSWETSRVRLAPSLRLLRLDFPVHEWRRALIHEATPPNPAPRRVHLVVYRREDGSVWDKELPAPALQLFELFAEGTPLLAACEQLLEEEGEITEGEVTEWLRQGSALGWIGDVAPE